MPKPHSYYLLCGEAGGRVNPESPKIPPTRATAPSVLIGSVTIASSPDGAEQTRDVENRSPITAGLILRDTNRIITAEKGEALRSWSTIGNRLSQRNPMYSYDPPMLQSLSQPLVGALKPTTSPAGVRSSAERSVRKQGES